MVGGKGPRVDDDGTLGRGEMGGEEVGAPGRGGNGGVGEVGGEAAVVGGVVDGGRSGRGVYGGGELREGGEGAYGAETEIVLHAGTQLGEVGEGACEIVGLAFDGEGEVVGGGEGDEVAVVVVVVGVGVERVWVHGGRRQRWVATGGLLAFRGGVASKIETPQVEGDERVRVRAQLATCRTNPQPFDSSTSQTSQEATPDTAPKYTNSRNSFRATPSKARPCPPPPPSSSSFFPDLLSLLLEVGGDVQLAAQRISEGLSLPSFALSPSLNRLRHRACRTVGLRENQKRQKTAHHLSSNPKGPSHLSRSH